MLWMLAALSAWVLVALLLLQNHYLRNEVRSTLCAADKEREWCAQVVRDAAKYGCACSDAEALALVIERRA